MIWRLEAGDAITTCYDGTLIQFPLEGDLLRRHRKREGRKRCVERSDARKRMDARRARRGERQQRNQYGPARISRRTMPADRAHHRMRMDSIASPSTSESMTPSPDVTAPNTV